MSGARRATKKRVHLSLGAIRPTRWWLRWQTDRRAYREVTALGLLRPRVVDAERPAA
jgi:hypothetical protein